MRWAGGRTQPLAASSPCPALHHLHLPPHTGAAKSLASAPDPRPHGRGASAEPGSLQMWGAGAGADGVPGCIALPTPLGSGRSCVLIAGMFGLSSTLASNGCQMSTEFQPRSANAGPLQGTAWVPELRTLAHLFSPGLFALAHGNCVAGGECWSLPLPPHPWLLHRKSGTPWGKAQWNCALNATPSREEHRMTKEGRRPLEISRRGSSRMTVGIAPGIAWSLWTCLFILVMFKSW